MKKLLTTLMAFVASTCAYALPVGNPTEASIHTTGVFLDGNYSCDPCDPCMNWCDSWSFRLGFYGDYVFNRHMEVNDSDSDRPDIDDVELYTNAGYLALNFFDRVDFFATLGSTDIWLQTPGSAFGNDSNEFVIVDARSAFSWSVGGRATLWECGCFGLGIEGQYFRTKPRLNYLKEEDEDPFYFDNERVRYREWQVGLGVSYRINIVDCGTAAIPYIAAKYSRARWDLEDLNNNDDIFLPELRSKKRWGYAVGVTLLGCNKWSVTAEGRYGDEKALYINSQFRF